MIMIKKIASTGKGGGGGRLTVYNRIEEGIV